MFDRVERRDYDTVLEPAVDGMIFRTGELLRRTMKLARWARARSSPPTPSVPVRAASRGR
jgi:hypothetical protein